MPMFASLLWWIVLGMLLGWMASWMFNRTLRTRVPSPTPKTGGIVQAGTGERIAERVATAGTAAVAATPTPAVAGPDLAAAAAAGFAPRHPDDLEIVEGIGPRIAALLRAEGVATWRALAACPPERIRAVLDLGGPGFRIADPGTWPEQAALAADDRWAELRALQDRLVAGRR
jgi:predicted flap endonuclease-1-like 5' DNA nuclease